MKIVGKYSFNSGEKIISSKYGEELEEIHQVVARVNSVQSRIRSVNRARAYQTSEIEKSFRESFKTAGWENKTIACEYPTREYAGSYQSRGSATKSFREIDFVKNRAGLNIYFSVHPDAVYDICAQMTIFYNYDVIDVGVGITPVKSFADQFLHPVLCFEQFVWDLEQRGVSNIDIPVLILGITA